MYSGSSAVEEVRERDREAVKSSVVAWVAVVVVEEDEEEDDEDDKEDVEWEGVEVAAMMVDTLWLAVRLFLEDPKELSLTEVERDNGVDADVVVEFERDVEPEEEEEEEEEEVDDNDEEEDD